MKAKVILTTLIAAAISATAQAQNHGHTYVGDSNQDSYLDFDGPILSVTLAYDNSVNIYSDGGFFFHGIITPTADHGSNVGGVNADPNGALSGTFIRQVLYGVTGPAGATFGFYEAGSDDVTLTLLTGMMGGTGSFALTEQLWFDVGDPYGHIHDRQFVADQPGEYTVTWALANSAGTGTGNSLDNPDLGLRLFTQTFTAVPEPGTLALLGLGSVAGLVAWRRRRR